METGYIRIREIKPAITAYLKKASLLIRKNPVPDEKSVHDIRVLMKKCRAVSRLISNQIDAASSERDMETYREIGRLMAEWRDSSVLRKTLRDLMKDYPETGQSVEGNEIIIRLLSKPEIPAEPDRDIVERVEAVRELLDKAGYRLRFVDMSNLDAGKLFNQLVMSHQAAIESYIICRHNAKAVNIHNFRKRAKDLMYQLWFFRPLNPSAVKNLEKRLDAITRNLGKHNDLSVLLEAMEYKYRQGTSPDKIDELALAVREEQEKYLSKVWISARKVFYPGTDLINMLGFRILIV